MSPYDGWLLNSLHELAVEIALNDPRTVSVARRPMNLALVCSKCHIILKRLPWDGNAVSPAPELAEEHTTGRGEQVLRLGVSMTPFCDGAGKPAVWHPIAED